MHTDSYNCVSPDNLELAQVIGEALPRSEPIMTTRLNITASISLPVKKEALKRMFLSLRLQPRFPLNANALFQKRFFSKK